MTPEWMVPDPDEDEWLQPRWWPLLDYDAGERLGREVRAIMRGPRFQRTPRVTAVALYYGVDRRTAYRYARRPHHCLRCPVTLHTSVELCTYHRRAK